jgi:hypothetical protein
MFRLGGPAHDNTERSKPPSQHFRSINAFDHGDNRALGFRVDLRPLMHRAEQTLPEPPQTTQSDNLCWTILSEVLCASEHVLSDVRLPLLHVLVHLEAHRKKSRLAAVFSLGLQI